LSSILEEARSGGGVKMSNPITDLRDPRLAKFLLYPRDGGLTACIADAKLFQDSLRAMTAERDEWKESNREMLEAVKSAVLQGDAALARADKAESMNARSVNLLFEAAVRIIKLNAAKEAAEVQLCRARELLLSGSTAPSGVHICCCSAEQRNGMSSTPCWCCQATSIALSFTGPCAHEEEAKRLREAVLCLYAHCNKTERENFREEFKNVDAKLQRRAKEGK
jgi:hypothetical protein